MENLDLKALRSSLTTWKHMLDQGPEFDFENEDQPVTEKDLDWIETHCDELLTSIEHTYFYSIQASQPCGYQEFHNYLRYDNHSPWTQIGYYERLRNLCTSRNRPELVSKCQRLIEKTRQHVQPHDLRYNTQSDQTFVLSTPSSHSLDHMGIIHYES